MLGMYVDSEISAEDKATDVGFPIDELWCNETYGRTADAELLTGGRGW